MINVRLYRRPRVAGLGAYPGPGYAVGSEGVNAQIHARLPQANVATLNARIAAQPRHIPSQVFVQPNPLGTQSPVGGGETNQAYFILQNEAAGGSDPTTGQENYETFVGPPYEAHRDDGTIEYIDPSVAASSEARPWWKTWGPPIALVGAVGLAFWFLRRPRRRR